MFQGRYSFYQALDLLNLQKCDEVLLPSYHCLSMVEPILRYGCKIRFYRIRSDLQTTIEDIDNAITNNTKIVFLVHFFGSFQKNIEEIKNHLTYRKIILVEDCAHIIPLLHQKAGKIGDISIFAPRKYLPLIDGALLRINNVEVIKKPALKKLSLSKELKVIKNTFEQHLNASKHNWFKRCYLMLDRVVNKHRNVRKAEQKHVGSSLPVEFDMNLTNKRCSHLASYILSRANFEDIYNKRSHAFQYMYDEIYGCHGLKPPDFLNSEPTECVFGFPVLAKNKREVIAELKKRNIQTFTFGEELYRHIPQRNTLVDDRLSTQLFFIPIHQDLQVNELKYISRNLKDILSKRV